MKHTDKLGYDTTEWKKAVRVMCDVPKLANDMMNVGRLEGFDVSMPLVFKMQCGIY